MNDDELILAAGRGDRTAFGVFVQAHHKPLLAFIARFLGLTDRATAEDLAQDVFVAAWQAAPRYRAQGKPVAWLLKIASRACLNWRRGQRLRLAEPLAESHPGTRQDFVTSAAEAAEHADRVRRALADLPPQQRAAILLRHFHGLAYQEIAEVLEVSQSAVESLLFRARQRLKSLLGKFESDPPQDSAGSRSY